MYVRTVYVGVDPLDTHTNTVEHVKNLLPPPPPHTHKHTPQREADATFHTHLSGGYSGYVIEGENLLIRFGVEDDSAGRRNVEEL